MSKNTPYSISIYLLLWVRWGNWNWVRTIDKNIVKDFYHIPTYVICTLYKDSVLGKWYASMWTGVVKENHIWWNTINQGINFHPYVKKCHYWFTLVFFTSDLSPKAQIITINYHMYVMCLDVIWAWLKYRKRKSDFGYCNKAISWIKRLEP